MTSSPVSQASAVTVDCASESCALAEAAPASEAAVVAPLYTSSKLHKRMMPAWQLAATYLQGDALKLTVGTCCPGAGVRQQASSHRRGSASQGCSSCSQGNPRQAACAGTASTLCTVLCSCCLLVATCQGCVSLQQQQALSPLRHGGCQERCLQAYPHGSRQHTQAGP